MRLKHLEGFEKIMMAIFNFFGSIFGYLLWALYMLFKNYGIAIILFTIIVKMLMFPFTLKSQRSMAAQSRLAGKQKELQQRYANNNQKYQEELQKLYQKEGINPGSGCLTTMLPLPIMLGIYYSVIYPLSNTLHVSKDAIAKATDFVSKLPGVVTTTSQYVELEIVKNFEALEQHLTMFSAEDMEKIEFFSHGFKFLGLDLLASPQGSTFASMMWIIPVLALLSYWAQTFIMQKLQPNQQNQQQGCMKVMLYGLPLLSAYWSFIMPGAVGFYWIISAIVGLGQSVLQHKFFSAEQVSAKDEASRYVTLKETDAKVKPLPENVQKQIAAKIEAKNQAQLQRQQAQQAKKTTGKKSGGSQPKNTNKNSSSDYMGSKK